jgi:hypothetical protein
VNFKYGKMTEDAQNFYDKYPEMIAHSIKMEEPNQSILIYSGLFTLCQKEKIITIEGTISFDWFPSIKVGFRGKVLNSQIEIFTLIGSDIETELLINNQSFGNCQISGTKLGNETLIEGFMVTASFIGDKTISATSIHFAIPNLKDFHGEAVKLTGNEKVQLCRRRLILDNEEYQIIIDGLPDYDRLKEKLQSQGGYIITYFGELSKSNKQIHYSDLKVLMPCFSCFLSFINGRRVATMFHQGIHEKEILWTEYAPYKLDLFSSVFSWSIYEDTSGFNDLWKNFVKIWADENNRDFLNSVIHWYLEANKNTTYIEGSIILTQVGLELIYNWYVIEKKKLILGKDADCISASNKVRLLLSQINITIEIPESLQGLKSYIKENELSDGIEGFVQIRNALVHSQEEKRKKLQKIDSKVLVEALHLGLWYLELSILHILNYKGKYQFRFSKNLWVGTNELKVPCVKE